MEENKKASIFEKLSLKLKKKWLTNRAITLLIAAILIGAFIGLNVFIRTLDLPEIDVTANKIYTLSDASKEAVSKVKQDVKIYTYGFEEDSSLIRFLKQYNKANEKITYEILTEETNPQMIKENELTEGYTVLILESGNSRKVIDAQNEFYTYDYTTFQQTDVTEQCITNAILALNVENKPNVYFLQGHNELSSEEVASLKLYLSNEAYNSYDLNLLTAGKMPDNCDLLIVASPEADLIETEVAMIQDYINKGGNIIFTQDMLAENITFPNFQRILDMYGVSIENGYIVEADSNFAVPNYPYIFMPNVSSTSPITQDIYTDSSMILTDVSRINTKSDDELVAMNITKEELLYSTEYAYFINNLNVSTEEALKSVKPGKHLISCIMTKNISGTAETNDLIESKLLVVSTGRFISDYAGTPISQNVPLSFLGSNRDFMLNSIANLTEREGTLTIRKDMANVTYTPTEVENRNVLIIIFVVPIIIILVGIIIGRQRRKRK